MTDRMAELDVLLTEHAVTVCRESFERHHPYVLSDGRRFCSLELAADTAYQMRGNATVTHEPSGFLYTWTDCARISTRDRRPAVA